MMINDGYTEIFDGIAFRRLLEKDFPEIQSLAISNFENLSDRLFSPPQVWIPAGRGLTDQDKQRLFSLMISNLSEKSDFENLKQCASLAFTNPRLFIRDCSLCQRFWFDYDTGLIADGPDGPRLRPAHAPVPCKAGRICEKGTDDSPIELSPRNRQAWKHWLEWHPVGAPECDSIVKRNWTFLSSLKDRYGLSPIHTIMD